MYHPKHGKKKGAKKEGKGTKGKGTPGDDPRRHRHTKRISTVPKKKRLLQMSEFAAF